METTRAFPTPLVLLHLDGGRWLKRWRGPPRITETAATSFERVAEYATPDLAYIVEIERYEARVGGRSEVSSVVLRVTTVLRPEDASWRIVHRHADSITTTQPAESVIQGKTG